MLAKDYIEKIRNSCQRALDNLDQNELRKALGDLDFVEHNVEAAKILIREELGVDGSSYMK